VELEFIKPFSNVDPVAGRGIPTLHTKMRASSMKNRSRYNVKMKM